MRIGTWNLEAKWDGHYAQFIRKLKCDVWLLTEVNPILEREYPPSRLHLTSGCMARGQRWAAILCREPIVKTHTTHPASALASVGDWWFCSSILPWRTCGKQDPWVGSTQGEKTKTAVDELLKTLPKGELVWGGDWNHSLQGRDFVGSKGFVYTTGCLIGFILSYITNCSSRSHFWACSGFDP